MNQRQHDDAAWRTANRQSTEQSANQGARQDNTAGCHLPDEPHKPVDRQAAEHPAFDREMLTVEEVAAMLAIGVRSVWRKAQDGRLPPPIKMTGSTRWAKSTLKDWITEQATAASKKQHASGRR